MYKGILTIRTEVTDIEGRLWGPQSGQGESCQMMHEENQSWAASRQSSLHWVADSPSQLLLPGSAWDPSAFYAQVTPDQLHCEAGGSHWQAPDTAVLWSKA